MRRGSDELDRVDPVRPSARAAVPFVAVAVMGLVSALLPPYGAQGLDPALAVVVLLLATGTQVVAFRRPRRSWVDPVGPWLFVLAITVLRDASGGTTSGLAPLIALPILWLALFGTRRDLMVVAVLTALSFLLPAVLVGEPRYPPGDWRRGLLWTAVAVFVAPVIQELVRQLARQTRREQEASSQIHGIMRGATLSGLISTDLDGTITSFSAGAEQLLGYQSVEMVGRRSPGFFHEPQEVIDAAGDLGVEPGFPVFAAMARSRSPSRTWTYVRKDGGRIFVRLAITELRDDDSHLVGYLGVAVDTTVEVETQRALEQAEERWRVVMDHLPDTTVLLLDAGLRIDLVTGAGAMRQGFGEVAGKDLSEVSRAENVAIVAPLVEAAMHGRMGRAEFTASLTGAEHEVQVVPLPATVETGAQALLLARDVSLDRAREREVARARDRAERLFLDAPHGIALLRPDGVVLQVNPALLALLDRTGPELVGRSLVDLGSEQDPTIPDLLRDLRDGLSGRSMTEWVIARDDGQVLHVTLSGVLLGGELDDEDQILLTVMDTSERHRLELQLAHLADHDPLTGLANRRRFSAEIDKHVEFCRRYGPRGAVLLLDLDHFKDVNDTLGHSAGDQLIVSIATLIRLAVRTTDLVSRLGGDEFAILLPEADRIGAELVAETVVTRIREHVRMLDGTRRKVTASIGVVMVDDHHHSPTDLMAAADMTMYDAKDAGRDQWVILDYDRFDQPRSGARIAWNSRIEDALAQDAFVLHLQPIFGLERGQVTGAEVLLRLADGPELVYPDRFLYIAERTGLIKQIDQWVLRHSLPILKRLQTLQPDFNLEVNLSGLSIGDRDLETTLREELQTSAVDPAGLVLEITETAAVADVQTARAFAERVTALGCSFALDDFGAGFGSFYYLKHLLFDYVKIDGEFVSQCHVSPTDRAIVHSIVGIAHDLGKRTIAEFVSEAAILDVVRAEGVDLVQGYHVGKPVPAEEFIDTFLAPRRL